MKYYESSWFTSEVLGSHIDKTLYKKSHIKFRAAETIITHQLLFLTLKLYTQIWVLTPNSNSKSPAFVSIREATPKLYHFLWIVHVRHPVQTQQYFFTVEDLRCVLRRGIHRDLLRHGLAWLIYVRRDDKPLQWFQCHCELTKWRAQIWVPGKRKWHRTGKTD